jgi:hypothetical protein
VTAQWEQWLSDLESAATRLEGQLATGELLDFPDLEPPPVDPASSGLPSTLLPWATQVLDRLERLERVARTQRDSLANRLHSLTAARPRPTAVPVYELGAALDVAG